ncbi:MAG: hypothetical protein HY704_00310 [Gemmatimonadetes bacterium]|nr:hypothetical protein [Gemmatimonadota bacterium]
MSLVVFPFKGEDPETVLHNVRIAASHRRVSRVLTVGAERDETFRALGSEGPSLRRETGTPLDVILQERIGRKRPGKGDAMNTALRWFLAETDLQRIHFYDADMLSFTADWITHAEESADLGFPVVRHYFPRATTDAMITFLIARTGFALLWPKSELPWIEQPLGGELLLTRPVAERLVAEERVQAQSDWGIDTVYTFTTVRYGFATYETYRREGKLHKLYGKLADLRTMLVECFAAIQELAENHLEPSPPAGPVQMIPGGIVHRVEPHLQVPLQIIEKVGFDFEGTLALLLDGWNPRLEPLVEWFPPAIRDGLLENRSRPCFNFMGEREWAQAYRVLLDRFQPGDRDWEEILFKLWTARVLNYTVSVALRGYGYARQYRHNTIVRYLQEAAGAGPATDRISDEL